MDVTYTLDPGPVERFGPLAIAGLERLNPAYVEGRIRWQRGRDLRCEPRSKKRAAALIETGLFSTVQITPHRRSRQSRRGADDDRRDRAIASLDRRRARLQHQPRLGARAFWENRNLFGNAEYLRLSAEVGQQIDEFRANFRRPDFLAIDQDFLATAEIANDTPIAYDSRRAIVTAGIERRFDSWLDRRPLPSGRPRRMSSNSPMSIR